MFSTLANDLLYAVNKKSTGKKSVVNAKSKLTVSHNLLSYNLNVSIHYNTTVTITMQPHNSKQTYKESYYFILFLDNNNYLINDTVTG